MGRGFAAAGAVPAALQDPAGPGGAHLRDGAAELLPRGGHGRGEPRAGSSAPLRSAGEGGRLGPASGGAAGNGEAADREEVILIERK